MTYTPETEALLPVFHDLVLAMRRGDDERAAEIRAGLSADQLVRIAFLFAELEEGNITA